ncbi:hypothetical protein, partial [Chryseobacterium sp. CCH4-E10]|uniref:hypothetical protein n=1 Tax=Chryseobacterium sp. CCH4-E10 TaxID=1768758 RepID=UPI001E463629
FQNLEGLIFCHSHLPTFFPLAHLTSFPSSFLLFPLSLLTSHISLLTSYFSPLTSHFSPKLFPHTTRELRMNITQN